MKSSKSIGSIFDRYGGFWNWDRLCDLTEPIADKIEKYIVVCYDNGVKSVVVPSKYSALYFRPWPSIKWQSTIPYVDDNMKACSMTLKSAEARLAHLKSCLKKKGRTYKIEPLTQQTLF